jgi:hypothetical protein
LANVTGNEAANEKGVDVARGGKDGADDKEGSVEQQRQALSILLRWAAANKTANPRTEDGQRRCQRSLDYI